MNTIGSTSCRRDGRAIAAAASHSTGHLSVI